MLDSLLVGLFDPSIISLLVGSNPGFFISRIVRSLYFNYDCWILSGFDPYIFSWIEPFFFIMLFFISWRIEPYFLTNLY